MSYTIAFQYQNREYYTELPNEGEVTFGCHKKDLVQIPDSKEHLLWLRASAGEIQVHAQAPLSLRSKTIECNELITLSREMEAVLYVSRIVGRSVESLELPYNGILTCGRRSDNDMILSYPIVSGHHFQIMCEAGQIHVEDLGSTNHLCLNGKRVMKAVMKSGDVLSIYTFRFCLENGCLYFENMGNALRISTVIRNSVKAERSVFQKDVKSKSETRKKQAKYLLYHHSPRIREQLPGETIVLSSAPGAGTAGGGRRGNMIYLLSSGAMMAASLATGMITPAALLARAAGMISPIANMALYGKMSKEEKKQLEEYEKMRHEKYQAYIDEQKARIRKVADVQRKIVTEENPVPEECLKIVQELRRNLWERMPSDSDFLTVRLGIGKDKLCVEVKSRMDMDGFKLADDDELEKLAGQIIEETRYVDNMPVRVSLKEYQTIGIIGSKEQCFYQLRSILVELTTQHSYKDLRIVGIFRKESRGYWGGLRWLPHIWDETGQVRYISFDETRKHNVCELISDVLRRRRMYEKGENRKENLVLPHYIIIVENQELLLNETIYDDIVSNSPYLGISTVFIADCVYNLPQTCQYLVDLTARPYAFDREKYEQGYYFSQDEPVHQAQLDAFTRKMAAIELEERTAEVSIPSAVTFLQGYKVETVEQLGILERWRKSESYQTLAAPIGMMSGGKIFNLDIRSGDTAHGPHGLLAGTTGSGKSELLQTWILSMAVNYHPHDVNFVIIDYKGGGMSDLLEPLPHVVGKITNIDRNISRSLISLKSELKRRQELFSQCGVNSIDKYQKAYQQGEVKVRLPHLIIVTDEFAEMKKEEPEFMTELNSVATIGRSLGIHMLLATQKPAGVVNDQINSNSRFRICMKVQDAADSREMLKRPDAAKITQSGRAYIRVGEDELFELFQSFYSGAEYTGRKQGGLPAENQVSIVGVTGNRINPVKKKRRKSISDMDELTAVIQHITEACALARIEKMPGPWLPELPKWLPLQEICTKDSFDGEKWPLRRSGLRIPIGQYDIPALQKQGIQYLDFESCGHCGVYGAPATGKTVLLKTVLTALGLHYMPKDIEITVIDAGNWSLSEFADMPHVQAVILNQEDNRIKKFVVKMRKEIEIRKKLFLKYAVSSLPAYREAASAELPAIIIMLDQLPVLFEQFMEFEELMIDIAASGAPYGIHLIYTANSTIGIRYKFVQLIKGAITLQMADKGDYMTLAGPIAGISLPNLPGRALIKGNPPIAFQIATYAQSEDEQNRHEEIIQLVEKMRHAAERKDDILNIEEHSVNENVQRGDQGSIRQEEKESVYYNERNILPIGMDTDTLEQVWLELAESYIFLISSDNADKNREVLCKLEKILEEKKDNQIIWLNKENSQEVLGNLIQILDERRRNRSQKMKNPDFDAKYWLKDYMQICLVVENLPEFAYGLSMEELKAYRRIFTKAAGLGVIVIVSGSRKQLSVSEPDLLTNAAVLAQNLLALEGMPADYRFFHCDEQKSIMGTMLEDDEAALMQQGNIRILKYK